MTDSPRVGPKVGIRDVARHVGVSVGTVSNVINRPDQVRPDTRAKVERAMGELHFVGSRIASQMRSKRSSLVGVVVPDVGNPFWADVLRGVEVVLDDHQLTLVVSSSRLESQRERAILTQMDRQQVDGIIVAPVTAATDILDPFRSRRLGVVTLDRQLPGDLYRSVSLDDVRGGELAAAHLLDNGYTRLALVNGPEAVSWSKDRRSGVRKALRRRRLPFSKHLLEIVVHEETTAAGVHAAAQLAETAGPRMGVVCGNDLLALGVLLGLQQAGLHVPDDFALVGYDDVEFAAALSPPLTSVRQPSYEMGLSAARLLVDGSTGEGRHVQFEPQLIARASSGRGPAPGQPRSARPG